MNESFSNYNIRLCFCCCCVVSSFGGVDSVLIVSRVPVLGIVLS